MHIHVYIHVHTCIFTFFVQSVFIKCATPLLLNVYCIICAAGLFLILCKYCNMPEHSRITCRRFSIKILVMLVEGGEFQVMNS